MTRFGSYTRASTQTTIPLPAAMVIEGAAVALSGLAQVVQVWGEYDDTAEVVDYQFRVVGPGQEIPTDVGGSPWSGALGKVWIWLAP